MGERRLCPQWGDSGGFLKKEFGVFWDASVGGTGLRIRLDISGEWANGWGS